MSPRRAPRSTPLRSSDRPARKKPETKRFLSGLELLPSEALINSSTPCSSDHPALEKQETKRILSRLELLPSEVLINILVRVLPGTATRAGRGSLMLKHPWQSPKERSAAVLRTCRRVYEAGKVALYSDNVFCVNVHSGGVRFFRYWVDPLYAQYRSEELLLDTLPLDRIMKLVVDVAIDPKNAFTGPVGGLVARHVHELCATLRRSGRFHWVHFMNGIDPEDVSYRRWWNARRAKVAREIVRDFRSLTKVNKITIEGKWQFETPATDVT